MRVALGAAVCACLALVACSQPPKEYDYPAWGFAASLPSQPREVDIAASADGSTPQSIEIESVAGGRDFVVDATDASKLGQITEQVLISAAASTAAKDGGAITSQTDVTLGGFSGIEVQASRPGKPMMVLREYVIGTRLYMVGATSTQGLDDPALKAFLASFKPVASPPQASPSS